MQACTPQRATERERIQRIVERDGAEKARAWARRTEALYRSAVLDPSHFAHTSEYRRRFIESYLQLKRFALHGKFSDAASETELNGNANDSPGHPA